MRNTHSYWHRFAGVDRINMPRLNNFSPEQRSAKSAQGSRHNDIIKSERSGFELNPKLT